MLLTGAKKSINQASWLLGPTRRDSKSLGLRASSLIPAASLEKAATSWAVILPEIDEFKNFIIPEKAREGMYVCVIIDNLR